jgi:hypothetical protein
LCYKALSSKMRCTCSRCTSLNHDIVLMIYDSRRYVRDLEGLGSHSTDLQRSKLVHRATCLRAQFDAWEQLQRVYMPSVPNYRQSSGKLATDTSTPIQNIHLILPSEATPSTSCDRRLLAIRTPITSWPGPLHVTGPARPALDALAYAGLQEAVFTWYQVDDT